MSQGRIIGLVVLVAVAALSWGAREINHIRIEDSPTRWVSMDHDGLYQTRRVERALRDGLPVAESDPYLNYPHGARIPHWPPYYTLVLRSVLGPFAPDDPEARRHWLEMRVASMPLLFGVVTSLLAAAGGGLVAGSGGAAAAGIYHALCTGSILYSRIGNGDLHAWVSMLGGASLLLLSAALAGSLLDRRRASTLLGLLLGAISGLMLGSWVGALVYIVEVQLVLGVVLVLHTRHSRAGLPAFGVAFHVAAALAVLPAVLSSPWEGEAPSIVIGLYWVHLAFLLTGALVFVPLLYLREGRTLRAYPWLAAGSLALVGGLFLLSDPGVRGALSWIGRTDPFMAQVSESRPLLGPGTGWAAVEQLGWGVGFLPIVWVLALGSLFRGGSLALLPWVVAGFLQTFGINNWNYLLLSQINLCIAFTAVWLLARQFFRPAQALAAVCLLEFVPYYSFLGIRLNHSSLLISLWALSTLLAYLAVMRQRLIYWVLQASSWRWRC